MHILLVEDDEMLGDALHAALQDLPAAVDWALCAREAEALLAAGGCDVIVLDLGLPDRSGVSLLRQWRGEGVATPVLVLTARDGVESRIEGLDAGADDYLIKPADLGELQARVRALHRRATQPAATVLACGDLELDPATGVVRHGGRPVDLPRREFVLLETLMSHPGEIIPGRTLEQHLYGVGEAVDSNALAVHIHNLRRKLGKAVIRTVRGRGYQLTGGGE